MAVEFRIYKVITTISDITCVMRALSVTNMDGMFPITAQGVNISVSDNNAIVYAEKAELSGNRKVVYGYFAIDALDHFSAVTIDILSGTSALANIEVPNLQQHMEPDTFSTTEFPDATLAWLETI